MTDATVLWPALLGASFLAAGIITYRHDLQTAASRHGVFGLATLGPILIAASLAAFAGEHFTAAKGISTLVPKWIPGPLFITYFVGVAHVCAALSLVARRCVRWSSLGLAIMFALFVALLYLPSAIRHPAVRMVWIFPVREGSFAMGGLAMFATAVRTQKPDVPRWITTALRPWAAMALFFFGIQNVLYPQFSPGVPDNQPTSAWVPFPVTLAYCVGSLLIVMGAAALFRKYTGAAISAAGTLMVFLAVALFTPDFFLGQSAAAKVNALNFVFDTLLFGGTLFMMANAVSDPAETVMAKVQTAGS